MGSISADWTENQSLSFDDSSPAKTVEGKADIDLAAAGYVGVVIQLSLTWGASADGPATINIYGSSNSGTTDDTEPIFSQSVEETASGTKVISIPIMYVPYIIVGIYNGNTAVEDLTISGIYAGLEFVTA
jgi:hypothetical protein